MASEGMNLCLVYRDRKADSKNAEEEFEKLRNQFKVKIITFNSDAVAIESIAEIVDNF